MKKKLAKLFTVMDFLFKLFESLQVDVYSELEVTEQSSVIKLYRLSAVSGLRHAKKTALSFKKTTD